MRVFSFIVFLSVSFMTFHSCSMDLPTKVEILRILSKSINVPDECLYYENAKLHLAKGLSETNYARLLVIYTSEDCNECAVSHLDDLTPLFSLARSDSRFKVEIFMTPDEDNYDMISDKLIQKGFKYPVYIDKKGVIETQIPSNPIFRILLLDKDNKVRFVGNPLLNKKALKKFQNKLELL